VSSEPNVFVEAKSTRCLLLFMCFHIILLLSTWWHCFILINVFGTFIPHYEQVMYSWVHFKKIVCLAAKI